MAEGNKLVLTFATSSGKTTTISTNYAKSAETLTTANVVAYAEALIENTAIFESTLTECTSAKLVTTTEVIYDLEDTSLQARGIPLYEALKRGIITPSEAEAELSDYDENGKLIESGSDKLPESLRVSS